MELTINITLLISICTLIVGLGGAVTWLKKLLNPIMKPMKELQDDVEELKTKTNNDFNRLNEHEEILHRIEKDNKELLKAVRLLLRHFESGNAKEEIVETRKEIDNYIINR